MLLAAPPIRSNSMLRVQIVQSITVFNSLYPPMTIEEGWAEFERIVEPMIRERFEGETKAASGGGEKGLKDPDEGKVEPPEEKPKTEGKRKK